MELDLNYELSFAPDHWWLNYSLFEYRSITEMGAIGLFHTRLVNFWERSYRHSLHPALAPLFNTSPYDPYNLKVPENFSEGLLRNLTPVRDSIKVFSDNDNNFVLGEWSDIFNYIGLRLRIDPVPPLTWGHII